MTVYQMPQFLSAVQMSPTPRRPALLHRLQRLVTLLLRRHKRLKEGPAASRKNLPVLVHVKKNCYRVSLERVQANQLETILPAP